MLRHKWRALIALIVLVVGAGSSLAVPRIIGTAVDEALTNGVQRDLVVMALGIAALGLTIFVAYYLEQYLNISVGYLVIHDLRREYFRKLQSLSFAFHDSQKTGDLISRGSSDMTPIRFFFGGTFGLTIWASVIVVGTTVILISMNLKLALIVLAFTPPIAWRTWVMLPFMFRNWLKSQEETGKMATVVQESITGMRVVKSFGAQDLETSKFEDRATKVRNYWTAASMSAHNRNLITSSIFAMATAAVLWFGAQEVVDGRLTPGGLAAFVLYLNLLAIPLEEIGWIAVVVSRASSAGQRIFEIIDAESPIKEKPNATTLNAVRGLVRFDHVSISYDSKAPALTDVDLEVQPGQVVAVLGAPGSGKSTLVHLIPRFYDVTEGRVTIDRIDVRDGTLESVRKSVGVVMQDVFAFSATLRDNITYGVDSATDDEVVAAAKVAQLHEFAEGLSDGYETRVGERGVTLSGGQRQRLAIARTVLVDPPILVFDDSTSSVDVETEYQIQQALAEVIEGRTTFIVAHRLSSVRNADLIVVMEDGRIVEQGSHEELLSLDGHYRRIHDIQLKPYEEAMRMEQGVESLGGKG